MSQSAFNKRGIMSKVIDETGACTVKKKNVLLLLLVEGIIFSKVY